MPRRVDIKLGFSCNNNCRFCVQGNRRKLGDKSTDRIKKELRETREEGIEEVVLTGGEPTVRNDITDIVSYAHDVGYRIIQIQTNGRMFFYKEFCRRMIGAGANEFSPAIHGHNAELHDYLTRAPGSFDQTVQGIKNLKELDQYVLTNSVVTKPNYTKLPELAELLVSLHVDQFQLAFVHAFGNAAKYFDEMIPQKSLAAPYIKKALQIGIDADIPVMVEAMPYCFMEGYEKYLSELYIPSAKVINFNSVDQNFELTRVKFDKCKTEKCKQCRYYLICEGPWREYPLKMGWGEFIPVKGKKIKSKKEVIGKCSS